jgi:molybdopterin-guanine dinucleotide biosynthesis protein A
VRDGASEEDVRAYILAGGRSLRWGADKAVALVDGRALALHAAEALRAAGYAPWLVAREARPTLGLPELMEPDGPRHPAWGLAHALLDARARGCDGAMFLPCDLVGVTGAQVLELARAHASASGQPLAGWWPHVGPGGHDVIAALLDAAGHGARMREIVNDLGLARLEVGTWDHRNRPTDSPTTS